MNDDYKFLTYKEAAIALATSVESVRVQSRRHNWPKRKNNQKQVTIGVPVIRLEKIEQNSEQVQNEFETNSKHNHVHELQKQVAILENNLKNALEKIDDLKADRNAWRQQANELIRPWWKRLAG